MMLMNLVPGELVETLIWREVGTTPLELRKQPGHAVEDLQHLLRIEGIVTQHNAKKLESP